MKHREADLTTATRENAESEVFQLDCKGKEACFVVCLQQMGGIQSRQAAAAFQQLFCFKSSI
ncbi:hypothetical protein HUU62_15985 [Rhodoferax sp. 4810]|nr:hypothetical protein [Rhodoferax jenense]